MVAVVATQHLHGAAMLPRRPAKHQAVAWVGSPAVPDQAARVCNTAAVVVLKRAPSDCQALQGSRVAVVAAERALPAHWLCGCVGDAAQKACQAAALREKGWRALRVQHAVNGSTGWGCGADWLGLMHGVLGAAPWAGACF